MRKITLLFSLVCLLSCTDLKQKEHYTIAFGSCIQQNATNHLWQEILDTDPELTILTGDNIYGDSKDPNVLKEKYQKQKSHPNLQKLFDSCPVIGTWDDHDFGINDGGKYFPIKDKSKELMLNFFEIPNDAKVRNRKGVYQSFTYNLCDDKTLEVILLDTRYFRDSLKKNPSNLKEYAPNPNGDILGEAQWTWLENKLENSTADFHILASSIQVIAKNHAYEKWANFPSSKKRLFDLIQEYKPNNFIIISGDRHFSEISKQNLPNLEYPLYDFTSSSMTHAWKGAENEENEYRVSQVHAVNNYGIIKIDCQKNRYIFEIRGSDNKLLEQMETKDM